MKRFRVQVDDTLPDKWRFFWAKDVRDAAAKAARWAGLGSHVAYVEIGKLKHPNGTPIVVEGFHCVVK